MLKKLIFIICLYTIAVIILPFLPDDSEGTDNHVTQLSQMTNETTDEIKWNKPGQNDVKDNRKKVHIDTEMSVWDVEDLKKQMGSEAGAMLSRFISQYNSIAEYQMDPESWSAKQLPVYFKQ